MFMVGALDTVPAIRPVLCLHETVCAGAADGFARMARRPACTLLHLGPGLANATAALHNARRARSPVVNLVGDMAAWHADADAPLSMDVEELACAVSGFARSTLSAATLERDAADAAAAATVPHGAHASAVGAFEGTASCRVASWPDATPPRAF
jgi:acetolactate synthase-1/2/3 large subunit